MVRVIKFSIFGLLVALFSCSGEVKTAGSGGVIDSSKLFVVRLAQSGVEQAVFDTIKLGRIIDGEKVESHFFVENVTKSPVVITNIITGCGCTNVDYPKTPIEAGHKSIVTVTYDSKGQYGTQMKAIEVVTSDYSVFRIYLSCTVVE